MTDQGRGVRGLRLVGMWSGRRIAVRALLPDYREILERDAERWGVAKTEDWSFGTLVRCSETRDRIGRGRPSGRGPDRAGGPSPAPQGSAG